MSVHKLQFKQIIAQPIEVVWQFFSNPNNLETITPPEMGFKHTVYEDDCVYAGMIILHKVKPVLNLPINWMTEITQVNAPNLFIDEQRKGIYSFWHHQHHFKSVEQGTEMIDIVHYEVPYGFLGDVVNTLYVRNKIQAVFDFRFKKVEEIFGK